METLILVGLVVDYIVLLMVSSANLEKYDLTTFQIKQLLPGLDPQDAKVLKKVNKHLTDITLLRQIEVATFSSIAVVLSTLLYGPIIGLALALVGFALIKALGRLTFVKTWADDLFVRSSDTIIKIARLVTPLAFILGRPTRAHVAQPQSLDELLNVIETLPASVVSGAYKQRLTSVLKTETKLVKDVMTRKKQTLVVDPEATLGPVLLSDLQKSGHGYFPVGAKKSDPEGLLDIGEISDIHGAKQNKTVRDIMDINLVWVEEDTSLDELVQAFLQEKQYLMFVRNLNGDFTGIVTIADLLEHLTGIVKE